MDPYAHLKENCWRESADLDARLAAGEIDEGEWHRAWQEILVPAYLAAETPWEQSGKSGTEDDWVYARALVAGALDRDGTFLDVGCANGYLMECLPGWTRYEVELEIEAAEEPSAGDEVVERDGVRVFLDATASGALADQVLEVHPHGDHVHFGFSPQPDQS